MANFKTNKIWITKKNGTTNVYNVTIKLNAGTPEILQDRTHYSSDKEELTINLHGLPQSQTTSYQVSHEIDFSPYHTSAYEALKVIVVEVDSPVSEVDYELFELNINDTPYPPPRPKFFGAGPVLLTDYEKAVASLQTPFSSFSDNFVIEGIIITDNGLDYSVDITVSYNNSTPPFYNAKSISQPPNLIRNNVKNCIILEVQETTNNNGNILTFPPINIPKADYSKGIALIVTNKKPISTDDWKLIDRNKAIIYA